MSEIKNCPFCNSSKLKYYEEESGFYITCLGCDTVAPTIKDPDKSIAAWNTRPIEDGFRARIKELEAWQKEAVEHLKDINSKESLEWACLYDVTELLIKQAEEK